MANVRWLSAGEQRIWRQWIAVTTRLPSVLGQALQSAHGISLQDYEVFVALSEAPDGGMRVSALASFLGWERSRLSHHLSRMAKRGLIERRECTEDGRGAYVTLTSQGCELVRAAAPTHVESVRHYMLDALGDGQLEQLDAITSRMLKVLPDAGTREQ